MTADLFRDDSFLRTVEAVVVAVEPEGVVLDRTIFYPQGGGQPGDTGHLERTGQEPVRVTATRYGPDRTAILHVVEPFEPPLVPGDVVTATIDWDQRFRRMRIHTALHLLTTVLPYPVTGGAIGEGDGRLDFDIPQASLDRADIETRLNALIATSAAIRTRWITDAELLANPSLIKTMSVKPPMGTGRVRLVEIVGLDLQPCGGTHVAGTAEIGRVAITGIEKKGRQNRRIRLALVP